MITEIILVIFAIVYYLFSLFFVATIMQDKNGNGILCLVFIICFSPRVTPIILGVGIGIKIDESIKEK